MRQKYIFFIRKYKQHKKNEKKIKNNIMFIIEYNALQVKEIKDRSNKQKKKNGKKGTEE